MSANFSRCGTYRWWLHRSVPLPLDKEDQGWAAFVMLNPSTAGVTADDPTIRRCIAFCQRFGFTGLNVINLFPYRATNPRDLRRVYNKDRRRAFGPLDEYERVIDWKVAQADKVFVAWGAQGVHYPEAIDLMLGLINRCRKQVSVLGALTQHAQPRHPLMLPANTIEYAYHTEDLKALCLGGCRDAAGRKRVRL